MHKGNWDDLRFVLAVARGGSVSAAARELGVNHATVLRRIAQFEDHAGAPIFLRTATGYQVLPNRLRVIEALREVESTIKTADGLMHGAEAQLSGVIRITSTDSLCTAILPQAIAQIGQIAPELRVELLCSNAHVDLKRLHADIAVRPTTVLPEDFIGQRSGTLVLRAYSQSGADSAVWLGLSGDLARSRAADWLATHVPAKKVVNGADSFLVLRDMAAAGLGCAILPSFLADGDNRLRRIDVGAVIEVPLWVASHSDLADVPRFRAMRKHLAEALASRPELQGS